MVVGGAAPRAEAVASLAASDTGAYEVLYLDPTSGDDAAQMCARFGPRVRHIRTDTDRDTAMRNAGLHAARGDYICCVPAADEQRPYRLRVQAALLDQSPDVALVIADFEQDGRPGFELFGPPRAALEDAFARWSTCALRGLDVPSEMANRRVYHGPVAALFTQHHAGRNFADMARTFAVRALGGYFEGPQADWRLSAELAKQDEVILIDVPMCTHQPVFELRSTDPRLPVERHRDLVLQVWRGDADFYAKHTELVDGLLGRTYARLGEFDASAHRWSVAEHEFKRALHACPTLWSAHWNLFLCRLRTNMPFIRGTFVDDMLPQVIVDG